MIFVLSLWVFPPEPGRQPQFHEVTEQLQDSLDLGDTCAGRASLMEPPALHASSVSRVDEVSNLHLSGHQQRQAHSVKGEAGLRVPIVCLQPVYESSRNDGRQPYVLEQRQPW